MITSISVPHEERGRVERGPSARNRHLAPPPLRLELDASYSKSAIDESLRALTTVGGCARFGRAGLTRRIRRAPARTRLSLLREKARLVTIRTTTTAGNRDRDGRFELRCHTPPSPPTNDPDESRSIRPPGVPLTFHERDP